MKNKFFTFIQPYLSYIDSGHFFRKPFGWLYLLFAVANLLTPLYVLYTAVDNHLFDVQAKYTFVFLIVWAIIAFASWVSFQLWWDRKDRVTGTSIEGDEFVATPVFSHLIQTFGEWLGTYIGVAGTGIAVVVTVLLGEEAGMLSRLAGLGMMKFGLGAILIMPVYGFLIIVFTRFLAEQARALASIANNTRKKEAEKPELREETENEGGTGL
jgi:hypothetical protein